MLDEQIADVRDVVHHGLPAADASRRLSASKMAAWSWTDASTQPGTFPNKPSGTYCAATRSSIAIRFEPGRPVDRPVDFVVAAVDSSRVATSGHLFEIHLDGHYAVDLGVGRKSTARAANSPAM